MRKILYLVTGTSVGGAERSLLEICRRLNRRRYSPTVVSLKKEGPVAPLLREAGVEVHSLGMREAADWLSVLEFSFGAFRLPRRLRGQSFDIVHSFLYRANILARFVAPRCGTPKLVNSIRITPDEETPMMRFLDRRTLNRVDRVCVLSEILSRDLQERLAFPPRRIIVIPNSIDVAVCDSALTTEGDRARAKLGLSPADLVVVSVGRLHRQKGFDRLLDAFRPFALEHPRGKLVIAGEGPQRQELEKKSEELRIPDRVLFTGLVPSPWPILAAADIFVLPSLYEGMPNALLEAMAAALPVVATPVGAVPEMITDGEEGLLVPPDDPEALTAALERLAWSPDLRRELGRRARERVERFYAPERTMEKLEALYESLLGEEGGPEEPLHVGARSCRASPRTRPGP